MQCKACVWFERAEVGVVVNSMHHPPDKNECTHSPSPSPACLCQQREWRGDKGWVREGRGGVVGHGYIIPTSL